MIKWNIVSVDVVPVAGDRENVISMARWACKASSDGKIGVELGATALGSADESFVPYDELTESDVLGFCWANGTDRAAVEAKAAERLQSALDAPTTELALPWA